MTDIFPAPQPAPPVQESFFKRISPALFIILSLALVFVLYQVIAGLLAILLFGSVLTQETAVWMRIATAGGQILCILIPTLLLTRARYGRIVEPLRIQLPSLRDIVMVSVALVALQQVLQGYMIAQDAIPLPPQIQRYVQMFEDMIERTYRMLVSAQSPVEFAGVVATVALVPAIAEELLFRGLVQRDLEKVTGGIRAAVIAGVIFALYHLNPFSIVPLIVLGVFFGYVVHRSQNITLAMIAHFLNNFLACCTTYFNLGDEYLVFGSGEVSGWSGVLVNTAVGALIFIAATYAFVRGYSHQNPV